MLLETQRGERYLDVEMCTHIIHQPPSYFGNIFKYWRVTAKWIHRNDARQQFRTGRIMSLNGHLILFWKIKKNHWINSDSTSNDRLCLPKVDGSYVPVTLQYVARK